MKNTDDITRLIEDAIVSTCATKRYHASLAAEAIVQILDFEGYEVIKKKTGPGSDSEEIKDEKLIG